MAREAFQTLTEPMYYILLALTQEQCGVDIMAKVKEISKGRVSVGPGTLYAMLQKFHENGVVKISSLPAAGTCSQRKEKGLRCSTRTDPCWAEN